MLYICLLHVRLSDWTCVYRHSRKSDLSPGNRPLIVPAVCALQVMLLLGHPENHPVRCILRALTIFFMVLVSAGVKECSFYINILFSRL